MVPGDEAKPQIDELFERMVQFGASDLHLKADSPPLFRVDGRLRRSKSDPLSAEQVELLVREWVGEDRRDELYERGNLDLAHEFAGGRVRVAVFLQRGLISMVARLVKREIPTLEQLHLPASLERILDFNMGLVLVCGITGSGKSTTLASLLQLMNKRHARHILTFEDPIEFIYTDENCAINQREFAIDFFNWSDAIRAGVRADPDVMLVGEMRDEETFHLGLTASETGHLVLGTMHTASAAATMGRILDLFPAANHKIIRQSLAFNLKGIICQRLVPSFKPGVGRVPALEVMWTNPPILKAIEEGEDSRLTELIAQGEEEGMQSWTTSFVGLIEADLIERKVAREYAPNKDALDMALKGITLRTSTLS